MNNNRNSDNSVSDNRESGLSSLGLSIVCSILLICLGYGFIALRDMMIEKDKFIDSFLLIVFSLFLIIPLAIFSLRASLEGKKSIRSIEVIFSKIALVLSILDLVGTILILVIGFIINY